MAMGRRDVLAAGALVPIAGCLSDESDADGGTEGFGDGSRNES